MLKYVSNKKILYTYAYEHTRLQEFYHLFKQVSNNETPLLSKY